MAKKRKAKPSKSSLLLFPKKAKRKLARQKRKESKLRRLLGPATQKSQQQQITDTLNFIQNNKNLNSSRDLSTDITSAIEKEMQYRAGGVYQDVDFINNRHTDLYDIDDTWSGTYNTLINHITIKEEFQSPEAQKYLQKVIDSDWGSQENYDKYIQKSKEQAYNENTKDLDIPPSQYALLQSLMNDSRMWHIIGDRHNLVGGGYTHYESSQTKEEWTQLHRDVQKLIDNSKTKRKAIKKLLEMLENFDDKASKSEVVYKKLVDTVDNMLKGIE